MSDHLFLMSLRQGAKTSEPETSTALDQQETERIVRKAFDERLVQSESSALQLFKETHISYLHHRLLNLPASFDCLDASQCWMAYWISHALYLLNSPIKQETKSSLIALLSSCQPKTGGFGGGPYQLSHLATTYGAINCLCLLGGDAALQAIDRPGLYTWLMSLRRSDGAYRMHVGGEVDVRGAYCAIAVASMTNLETERLFAGTAEWIALCQTYEGGFGGYPGLEAHGGYSFCAFAALVLLKQSHVVDVQRLLHWASSRQMALEGGFQGRTNKLVDSCYSFWVGGLFPLIHQVLTDQDQQGVTATPTSPPVPPACDDWLFHTTALQEYLLICCQKHAGGGMIDKPGKNADPYHTCYALSGLSLTQHFRQLSHHRQDVWKNVQGSAANELEEIDTLHNVASGAVAAAVNYFQERGVCSGDQPAS